MKEDHAGRIHRDKYGCSDKVNAPKNQNREFQEGYGTGILTFGKTTSGALLEAEKALRKQTGECLKEGFEEWKRGLWAARTQMVAAKMRRLPIIKL